MRIHQSSRLIVLAALVLSALTVVCAFLSAHYRQLQDQANETRLESLLQADQLAAGSDRLTAAVRGYAATGDARYHEEFLQELNVTRSRDKAVKRLQELGIDPRELALIERAKQNSDGLVSLENEAIQAVADHDLNRAIALVFGDRYREAKASIMKPILESRAMMETRLSALTRSQATRATTIASLALVSLLLDILAILAAVFLFYHRRVVKPLSLLTQDVQNLVEGQPGAAIGLQNDPSEIGDVARCIEQYRLRVEQAERQNWVKTHLAEIAESIQSDIQPEELGEHLLGQLVPLMGGGSAVLHLLREEDGRLHCAAGYACKADRSESFALGQGLPGQAAEDKKLLLLRQIPADYVRVGSGLGQATPLMLALMPIVTREKAVGVIELANFSELSFAQRSLLEELSKMLALKLDVLLRNEQVRTSEERTRLILESSDQGIFGTDTEGRFTFLNPAACRMLGYEAAELVGRSAHQTIHHSLPDGSFYPIEQCPMQAAVATGTPARLEHEFLWRKDGVGFPVEYSTRPMAKDGTTLGAVVTFTDITERKQAEAALKRASFLSDIALELTNSGYWHVDYSMPDTYWQSERAARMLGEEPRPDGRYRLDTEWFARLVEADPEGAAQTSELYQKAIDGTLSSYDATYAYKRPADGRIIWLHALGKVVRGSDDKILHMYGVYQDVTELKRLEAELRSKREG